jgi:hypothetical protein
MSTPTWPAHVTGDSHKNDIRRMRRLVAPLLALTLTSCASQPLSTEWIPRLQDEISTLCSKPDCSSEATARRLTLFEELQGDAANAGSTYTDVAKLAGQVNSALLHWDHDCTGRGGYSAGAGMSCDQALNLVIEGPDLLAEALEKAEQQR